jgi:RecB family exonuclease
LQGLLQRRLENYQLSPTHLTKFIDLEYGGPEAFFFDVLLCFPQAPSISSQFGNAIHETLEWVQHQVAATQVTPSTPDTIKYFATILKACALTETQKTLELERGEHALTTYLSARSNMFQPTDKAEQNFRNEGVFIGDVHMSGKIDRMEIDQKAKTVTVIDYKTGKSYDRWGSEAKLYKYQLQLYCYKLLIENSHTYKGYKVVSGRLEFIEPDQENHIHALELHFTEQRTKEVEALLQAMWQRVKVLNLPDVSSYSQSGAGIKAFETDLLQS